MKKQQYVAAVACLVAGAIGFVSVYATEKTQEKRELAQQEQMIEETQELSVASNELEPQTNNTVAQTQVTTPEKEPEIEAQVDTAKADQEDSKADEKNSDSADEKVVATTAETLHFQPEKGLIWPVEGEVLLDYSMDSTIFFPTLEQYRCNPALVIAGQVNDKVYAAARGKIIEIYNSEETGCTVKQDLGDGYVAIYGQLKELNFDVGDTLEAGQVVGYVSEPTKYYSVEGSNVYFELQKDGAPVNPSDYLPEQIMDTLD